MIIKKQLFPNENNSTKQFQIFNADDEEPDCMRCGHCSDAYDCCNNCGPEHGWAGYCRVAKI